MKLSMRFLLSKCLGSNSNNSDPVPKFLLYQSRIRYLSPRIKKVHKISSETLTKENCSKKREQTFKTPYKKQVLIYVSSKFVDNFV